MSRIIKKAGGTSGKGYTLPFAAIPGTGNFAPGSASTYYFGSIYSITPQTVGGLVRIYIPVSGTIIGVSATLVNAATASTAENSSMFVRLNNTSDTLISSTIDTSGSTPAVKSISNLALSIPVVAGDYIEIKWTTPTWSTAPGAVRFSGTVMVV